MLLSLAFTILTATSSEPSTDDRVNAVIGDESWALPTPVALADEATRIQVHLRFVGARLMARTAELRLTERQRRLRTAALERLRRYADTAVFPQRSGDPYPGRRPRFVDERGVHCAVGQLLVDSGEEALARSLANRFEYALLAEIEEPALHRWASDNGFTVTELAMIQPSYTPAHTPDEVRRHILENNASATLRCMSEGPPPRALTLIATIAPSDDTTVVAKERDAFSTCYASAAFVPWGGAPEGQTVPGRFSLRVNPPRVQTLFEGEFDSAFYGEPLVTSCLPRPGAVASHAVFTAAASKLGLVVVVKTTPRNDAVERCLTEKARQRLSPFARSPVNVSLRRERWLASSGWSFDSTRLRLMAESTSQSCGAPVGTSFAVAVLARKDAESLEVVVGGGTAAARACTASRLEDRLRDAFTVPTEVGTSYFRVDHDVFLGARVETPAFVPVRPPHP